MDLVDATSAAELIGVSRQYVLKLAKQGRLAGVRVGSHRLFERQAVQAFAEKRRYLVDKSRGIDRGTEEAQDTAR